MNSHPITIAQLNPIVGDIAGNAEKIRRAYENAVTNGAQIVLCPELCLVGYPPEDLVLSPSFVKEAMQSARDLAAKTTDAALVFGTVWAEGSATYNAAIFAAEGRIQYITYKMMLPNYGVFDEKRIFTPGHEMKVFEWCGVRYALLICEDVWFIDNAQGLAKQHPDCVLVINASPFEVGKLTQRKHIAARFAETAKAPLVYANMVGGQDDIVFDGASFVVDEKGYVTYQAEAFREGAFPVAGESAGVQGAEESIWQAMKLGLCDYVNKNGFKGVLLGLSGGIDSAITAACAVDALGAGRVHGVLLPSPYTSQESVDDALETARLLGIHTDTISITPAMQTYEQSLSAAIEFSMEDPSVGGNIQARIRGQLLMALSNKTGFMLLSTGNKSEIAVGYSTLYGDSCGGYNVLKDVYKTQVYALAEWRNTQSKVIPARSITKAPSAELKPDQKDEDQLPPYAVLDAILLLFIEGRKSLDEIVAAGFDAATVKRVMEMVQLSEYKRRQSCPGVKISSMMFGRDRRFPLTNGAKA